MKEKHDEGTVQWDRIPLSERRAAALAEQTGLPGARLAGRSLAELADELRFRIDPELLWFRRVCGRVVRRNPVTGQLEPVPGATVHVEDTDCRFLGYFPVEGPLFWLYPVSCYREEIATVVTDRCGRFCVYVPRWEIDRIHRWRLRRRCYSEIVRPTRRELLERYRIVPRLPIPRPPFPEPPPFDLARSQVLPRVVDLVGQAAATQLVTTGSAMAFGEWTMAADAVLDQPAFTGHQPPPLGTVTIDDVGIDPAELDGIGHADRSKDSQRVLDNRRFLGPFLRCENVLVSEWTTVLDVPDITFRVTQDVDGDGAEEQIYGEGHFDVRWNSGPIPDVTLITSATARSVPMCEGPDLECQDVPAIRTVGLMPVQAPYHDPVAGYALRTNQPRPGGLSGSPRALPASTPYCQTLQLHGCHHLDGAAYYRLRYSLDGASPVPFTDVRWWAPKLAGGLPFLIDADADGWLPVLPANQLVFPHWLLNWETGRYPDGRYEVTLEVADAAKTPVAPPSAPVAFVVDNSGVSASLTVRWRTVGTPTWTTLPELCPVIRRGHQDVEVDVAWQSSAQHLFHAEMFGVGCEDTAIDRAAGSTAADHEHWHTSGTDNAYAATGRFVIPRQRAEGAYTFGINAYSRAYNPAGSDAGPGLDFVIDHAFLATYPRRTIALVE